MLSSPVYFAMMWSSNQEHKSMSSNHIVLRWMYCMGVKVIGHLDAQQRYTISFGRTVLLFPCARKIMQNGRSKTEETDGISYSMVEVLNRWFVPGSKVLGSRVVTVVHWIGSMSSWEVLNGKASLVVNGYGLSKTSTETMEVEWYDMVSQSSANTSLYLTYPVTASSARRCR